LVGLASVSIVLLDLLEVLLEDGEAVGLLRLGVLPVEEFLELLELNPGGRVLMLWQLT